MFDFFFNLDYCQFVLIYSEAKLVEYTLLYKDDEANIFIL